MVLGGLVFVGDEIRVIENRGYVFVYRLLRIEQMTSYPVDRVGIVGVFAVSSRVRFLRYGYSSNESC